MPERNPFFPAPDLNNKTTHISEKEDSVTFAAEKNVFSTADNLDGSLKYIEPDEELPKDPCSGNSDVSDSKNPTSNIPLEFTDELKKKWSATLLSGVSKPHVKNVATDSFKEHVIIRFVAKSENIYCDIEVPLNITANDLIVGLNSAYKLGIDISDVRQCYLSCENPVVLLKGQRSLGEYGVRDGSLISFFR